jgi:septal ring factor EnvC (AmiA/AmiB activator)
MPPDGNASTAVVGQATRAVAPSISEPEQIQRDIEMLDQVFGDLWEMSNYGNGFEQQLGAAIAWTETSEQRLIEALDRLDQPATKNDIRVQVMMLIAAYPNNTRADLKIYSATLAEDIGAAGPGRLALDTACRRVRRSCRFTPSIAEVLEALTTATKQIRDARWKRAHVRKMIEEKTRELENHRSWREFERQKEERRQAREQQKIDEERQP